MLGDEGGQPMNTFTRVASIAIVGGAALLAGCATQEELAVVRSTAVAAEQKADAAIQRSDLAGQKADVASQRADQATQIAQTAQSNAQQAEATANAANATAQSAKGVADTVQSALNAHTVVFQVAQAQGWHERGRHVARNERGEKG